MNSLPTVLVVDDDAVTVTILAHLLEAEFDVLFASNGSEALTLAKTARPDLVLLDVMMSEMNGYEVCKRLKVDPDTADIPVIFITGLDDAQAESQGLEAGALDYVTKPFNAAIVRAARPVRGCLPKDSERQRGSAVPVRLGRADTGCRQDRPHRRRGAHPARGHRLPRTGSVRVSPVRGRAGAEAAGTGSRLGPVGIGFLNPLLHFPPMPRPWGGEGAV